MCLPFTHTFSSWTKPSVIETNLVEERYPLVFDIIEIRVIQEKICSKCNKTVRRLVDKYNKMEDIRGSYKTPR